MDDPGVEVDTEVLGVSTLILQDHIVDLDRHRGRERRRYFRVKSLLMSER